MIRIRNVVLSLLLLAVVTACGSSSSGGSTTAGSGSTTSSGNAVAIKGYAFTPSTLTVKKGTKVTFTNEDPTTHTATSQGNSTINSGDLKKGQSYTVTFTKPGTYQYICMIHQYMHGTIVVQP
jgi:plastocyanin